MEKSPSKETWQSRLLAPRLPWGGAPLRPAEVGEGLCAMMVARENVLEDANYHKTVPNRYIVEVAQAAYQRNFQPLEDQIIQQWIDRIKNHLLTTNSRTSRPGNRKTVTSRRTSARS